MVYPTRIKYTAAQKAEIWERWQKGESLNSIARLFDRSHSSIQGILAVSGGIRPRERRRSRRVLTLSEREHISRGFVAGDSIRSIARSLARAVNGQSRDPAQRRASSLPGLSRRSVGLGAGKATQAM